jgi:hypothetical protein
MFDNCDGTVNVLHERHPTARIEHKCGECFRVIKPGEKYMVERYVFDGSASTHKTCEHCQRVRSWLLSECGGFMYSGIEEDIREHADDPHYGIAVKMMAVGMARCWTRKNGKPWPLPRMPKTTVERMAASH